MLDSGRQSCPLKGPVRPFSLYNVRLWARGKKRLTGHFWANYAYRKGTENMNKAICTGIGVVGSAIAALFGGWDAALITLMIFMAVDYVTGLLVAGVFHNSEKTPNGTLESRAGWKGLCRKGVTLLVVLVACRLDLVTGANFIRDAVVIGFIANETISIVENAGLMGIPIPAVIMQAIDVLKHKAEGGEGND